MLSLSFKTRKLKGSLVKINKRYRDYPESNPIVYGVSNKNGVTITGKEASNDVSNYIIVEGKIFAYNPYRINIGSIGLTDDDFSGIISPAYVAFKTKKDINPEFLLLYLKSSLGINLIKWYGDRGGVRSALRFQDLEKIDFPDLTYEQQTKALVNIKKFAEVNFEFNQELESQEYYFKKIRQSILQEAVEGKLVPQNPNDEPASELLKKIKAEKEKLIKEGKIKKEKPLPPISQSENPYDLPKGWEFVRLADVGQINPRNYEEDETEASFVPMTLINAEYGAGHSSEIRLWKDIKSGFTHFAENDVSLAKITPCFENGKSAVMQNLKNGIGAGTTELHIYRNYLDLILPKYVLINFKTSKFLKEGERLMTGSAGQKRVPKDYVKNYILPLPPLEEQKRIVEKVDELMVLCNELEIQIKESKQTSEQLMQAVLQEVFAQ